jgi:hypothetical protein
MQAKVIGHVEGAATEVPTQPQAKRANLDTVDDFLRFHPSIMEAKDSRKAGGGQGGQDVSGGVAEESR